MSSLWSILCYATLSNFFSPPFFYSKLPFYLSFIFWVSGVDGYWPSNFWAPGWLCRCHFEGGFSFPALFFLLLLGLILVVSEHDIMEHRHLNNFFLCAPGYLPLQSIHFIGIWTR